MGNFNGFPFAATTFAYLGLSVANMASAATAERLTRPEIIKLNECMAMTPEVLEIDGQCTTVMKKANLTKGDIEKMRKCEQVQNDVMSNPDCKAMIEKHPDLVRGHGRVQPEQPPVTPPTH